MDAKARILVVEDLSIHQRVLSRILRDEYTVTVSGTAEAALEVCRSDQRPDLILLDIMLPGMSGFELTQVLKSDPATSAIPVIFISGMENIHAEKKGLDLGAVDFIFKPPRPEIVKARVRNQLRHVQQARLLEEIAFHDALTHLPNRRRLLGRLGEELAALAAGAPHLSICLVDVDHFKQFNDTYGHGAGDVALQRVADCLQQCVRGRDLAARYGGEEFAVVLPETEAVGAVMVANRIRATVEAMGLPHVASSTASVVTISIGATTLPSRFETSPEAALGRADRGLYAAKATGRNRVQWVPVMETAAALRSTQTPLPDTLDAPSDG